MLIGLQYGLVIKELARPADTRKNEKKRDQAHISTRPFTLALMTAAPKKMIYNNNSPGSMVCMGRSIHVHVHGYLPTKRSSECRPPHKSQNAEKKSAYDIHSRHSPRSKPRPKRPKANHQHHPFPFFGACCILISYKPSVNSESAGGKCWVLLLQLRKTRHRKKQRHSNSKHRSQLRLPPQDSNLTTDLNNNGR